MKSHSATVRLLLATLVFLIALPLAHGDILKYNIHNVQVGINEANFQFWTVYASGEFTYNTSTGAFSDIDISVSNFFDNGEQDSSKIEAFPYSNSGVITLTDNGVNNGGYGLFLYINGNFSQGGTLTLNHAQVFDYSVFGGYGTVTGASGDIVQDTPEPGSLTLLGSGLIGLAGLYGRRRLQ